VGIKAFLIGATSSGTGKTSICAGIGRALRRRGLRVQFCKVGPDYIDPTWLSAASDRQCVNLDIWMHGRDGVRTRFQQVCADADICIIEGVMGLYDGVDARSIEGSSADVANLLGVPVLLIADASGCARSFAAVIYGFAHFPDAPEFLGCIANRVGSSRHGTIIHESLEDVPNAGTFFASLPDNSFPSIDSRHLGLHMAAGTSEAVRVVNGIADAIEHHVNLDALLHAIPLLPGNNSEYTSVKQPPVRCRLAIAKDEAFCFYYPEWVHALEAAGAEVVPFSPVHDQTLPDNCDGLLLGGGYPELHCKELAGNDSMLQSIRNLAAAGKPVYAECGGLMYLSQGIRTADGNFPMLGIMPAWTQLNNHLHRLGYVQLTLQKDCILGKTGDTLRGHEYHYSQLESDPDGWECVYSCFTPKGEREWAEGWRWKNILASYIHLPMDVFTDAIETLIHTASKARSL
jgi:cobyrinic acid a,c-diamide synthase